MGLTELIALAADILPKLVSAGTSVYDAWKSLQHVVNPDGTVNADEVEKLKKRGDEAMEILRQRAADAAV